MKKTALVLAFILALSVLGGCANQSKDVSKTSANELYFTQQEIRKSPEHPKNRAILPLNPTEITPIINGGLHKPQMAAGKLSPLVTKLNNIRRNKNDFN